VEEAEMDILKETDDFLRGIGVHPDQTDIKTLTDVFLSQMDSGLNGLDSSLAMIPTYIDVKGTPADDSPVIAIDAGGTNLRVGLVTFRNGQPVTEHLEKCAVPGSRGEVTKDEFFGFIANLILPLTEYTDKVGFCFSYPMEVTEDLDGIIQLLNKELRVTDVAGAYIGRTLDEKLKERGVEKSMHFVLINDTVAGLMGGLACLGLDTEGGIAGLILGTGSNICYLEKGSKIGKLQNPGDMIINCESGNFNGAFRGEPDRLLDAGSKNPGRFWFEKMMSGAYLGNLISKAASLAAEKGLLSPGFKENSFMAPELDDFLRGEQNRISRLCTGDDRQVLSRIIDTFFERSAKLVCGTIAALILHTDGGKTPEHSFTIVAEGSMFWVSMLLKDKLDKYIKEYIEEGMGRCVRICRAENSTMAGSAMSTLLNLK